VMAVVVLLVNFWALLGRDVLGVGLDGTENRLAFVQTLFELGEGHFRLGVRLEAMFAGKADHVVVVGAVLLRGAELLFEDVVILRSRTIISQDRHKRSGAAGK